MPAITGSPSDDNLIKSGGDAPEPETASPSTDGLCHAHIEIGSVDGAGIRITTFFKKSDGLRDYVPQVFSLNQAKHLRDRLNRAISYLEYHYPSMHNGEADGEGARLIDEGDSALHEEPPKEKEEVVTDPDDDAGVWEHVTPGQEFEADSIRTDFDHDRRTMRVELPISFDVCDAIVYVEVSDLIARHLADEINRNFGEGTPDREQGSVMVAKSQLLSTDMIIDREVLEEMVSLLFVASSPNVPYTGKHKEMKRQARKIREEAIIRCTDRLQRLLEY